MSQQYESALSAVQRVCGRLGLPVPNSVFSSGQNQTAQQMGYLLTEGGRKLRRANEWQQFERQWELTTQVGVTEYDLPSGWDGFIDSTGWNQTTGFPALGPASPQQWNALKSRLVGPGQFDTIYRVVGSRFVLLNPPTEEQNLLFAFRTRNWVRDPDMVTERDQALNDGDMILFDPELVAAGIKLLWLQAKGFDTRSAQAAFENQLEQTINRDKDASTLSLVGRSGPRFLNGFCNLPESGFGL